MKRDKRISRRDQTDHTSVDSLVKSNVSRALRVRIPVNPLPPTPIFPTKRPKFQFHENPFMTRQQQQKNPISTVPVGPRRSKRTRQDQDSTKSTFSCSLRNPVPKKTNYQTVDAHRKQPHFRLPSSCSAIYND